MVSLIEKLDIATIATVRQDSLDVNRTDEFKNDIIPVLEQHKNLILDMSNVVFIDSSGCGSILSCLRRINKLGGTLKLFGVQQQVQMVFELIRFHRILEIFSTRDEALNSFK